MGLIDDMGLPRETLWELKNVLGSWRKVGRVFGRSGGWAHHVAHGRGRMGPEEEARFRLLLRIARDPVLLKVVLLLAGFDLATMSFLREGSNGE